MNQELKAKWLEALRSGNYQQGKGSLKVVLPDGPPVFCCLGVLADVMGKTWTSSNYGGSEQVLIDTDGGRFTKYLPNSVESDAGLPMSTTQKHLAMMNDAEGKTFDQIADYIEANL